MSTNINFLIKKIKKNKFKSPRISYTSFLIKKSTLFCLKKLNEEFLELRKELLLNRKKKIIYETADLIYHLLVLLEKKKINFFDVIKELKRRQKTSGLVEKNNRKKNVR
jgi:phosphoribosyl-ATP pyrophosphohydrolase